MGSCYRRIICGLTDWAYVTTPHASNNTDPPWLLACIPFLVFPDMLVLLLAAFHPNPAHTVCVADMHSGGLRTNQAGLAHADQLPPSWPRNPDPLR